MSTSATITFSDSHPVKASVYSHSDGYPSGIDAMIVKAKALAWELPRFEADEFAAAFIAANKVRNGEFRVIANPRKYGVAYHYDITLAGSELYVKAYRFDMEDKRTLAYKGPLSGMVAALKE